MDAPPDKEPIGTFLAAAEALTKQGVHVPEIRASSAEQGFILMEDLGGVDYLSVLVESPNELYEPAIESLIRIQSVRQDQPDLPLPLYNAAHLEMELDVFDEWYVQRHLDKRFSPAQSKIWQNTKTHLIDACLEQPQVWVHRDSHSRNLMACDDRIPGVIDFQDLLIGPLAYDVVSLFRDCYIEWPQEHQERWCEIYLKRANHMLDISEVSMDQFMRWYDFTGLQRHLKVLGVFSRLHYRDGKSQYLNDIPLVRKYVSDALEQHPELDEFRTLFDELPHA